MNPVYYIELDTRISDLSNILQFIVYQEVMNRKIIISVAAFLVFILSCSSNKGKYRDHYEGLMGHTLRVFVKEVLPDEEKEYTEKEINTLLKNAARKRATILITGYFQLNHPEMMRDASVVREIMKAFEKDIFIRKECDDKACSALIDYRLKRVMAMIDDKNKNIEKPSQTRVEKKKTDNDSPETKSRADRN